MTFPMYNYFGGVHSETAALGNALACLGVTAQHTRRPFTEAMLLGIGGGVGAMYFVYDFKGSPPFLILYSRHIGEEYDAFPRAILDRLGIRYTIHQSGGRKTADAQLRALAAAGRSPLAWVDLASLPYRFLPAELVRYFHHVVRVCGWDEAAGLAYLDDLSPAPWPLPLAELAAGRGAITSQKNRLLALEPPERLNDLGTAIRQGIGACAEGLTGGRLRNVSLTALEK